MTTTLGTTLRLYRDPGTSQIWQLRDDHELDVLSVSPDEFSSNHVLDVDRVRLLGTASNAQLICWLTTARNSGSAPYSVQVGTPQYCSRKDFDDPKRVLSRMQELDSRHLSSSTGGWHEVSQAEFYSYLLVCAVAAGNVTQPELLRLLRLHPAWPAVSFIPSLNARAAAQLLAEIVDPRWYVDVKHPGRMSKLKAYVGAEPHCLRKVISNKIDDQRSLRASYAAGTWMTSKQLATSDKSSVANFVYRCYQRYDDKLTGAARATALLLRFICEVWLDSLYPDRELFVPEYFFSNEQDGIVGELTAQAYQHHCRNMHNM